jgi:isopenicillin N synthase-like dioxygenase
MLSGSPKDDDRQAAQSVEISRIPIVDFTGFLSGSTAERRRIADEIIAACETIGFFYLTGHGVTETKRQAIFDRAEQFFHLPKEQKEQSTATQEWNRGYIFGGSADRALDANTRVFEQYRIQREFAPDDPDLKTDNPLFQPNRWPSQIDGFGKDCIAYYDAMSDLASELLQAIAIGLDLPEDRFVRYFRKPVCQISLMYYPALPGDAGNEVKNLSIHTDEGPVVILAQGKIGGLEVKTSDGRWLAAPPIPGAFTINIGNMMMWWSNGRLKSTLHRVRNTSGQERFSVPFFWNADPSVIVEPLPELVERDGVSRYKPVEVGPLLSRFYKSAVYTPPDTDNTVATT